MYAHTQDTINEILARANAQILNGLPASQELVKTEHRAERSGNGHTHYLRYTYADGHVTETHYNKDAHLIERTIIGPVQF